MFRLLKTLVSIIVSCIINASSFIGIPVVYDFNATNITSTNITLAWTSPSEILPSSYIIDGGCSRFCESSFNYTSSTSVFSPYYYDNAPPYSQCLFDLIGVYGEEMQLLSANLTIYTISVCKWQVTCQYNNDNEFSFVSSQIICE